MGRNWRLLELSSAELNFLASCTSIDRCQRTDTGALRRKGKESLRSCQFGKASVLNFVSVMITCTSTRSLQNFNIGGKSERMPEPLIRAYGVLKMACAHVNMELGVLDGRVGNAIVDAATEVSLDLSRLSLYTNSKSWLSAADRSWKANSRTTFLSSSGRLVRELRPT